MACSRCVTARCTSGSIDRPGDGKLPAASGPTVRCPAHQTDSDRPLERERERGLGQCTTVCTVARCSFVPVAGTTGGSASSRKVPVCRFADLLTGNTLGLCVGSFTMLQHSRKQTHTPLGSEILTLIPMQRYVACQHSCGSACGTHRTTELWFRLL